MAKDKGGEGASLLPHQQRHGSHSKTLTVEEATAMQHRGEIRGFVEEGRGISTRGWVAGGWPPESERPS